MPEPCTIVLLGAPGTGAAELCKALQARLDARHAVLHHIPPSPPPTLSALPAAALVLLMGLDLACPGEDTEHRAASDAHLRGALAQAQQSYRVVYGSGEQRVASALNAIYSIAPKALHTDPTADLTAPPMRLRDWNCEKCSDPDCEYRLFSALRGGRSG